MNSLFPSPGPCIIDGIANTEELIATRLLIQGTSGAGKTYAIRNIMENASGRVQIIILDVEDDFSTLCQLPGSSFLLVGGEDGHTPLREGSAGHLARRILETGASAIIQLNAIGFDRQRSFMKQFISSLMDAPRSMWRPLLVVIDEAHRYAPNQGNVESSEAITMLATAGRNRGYCLIAATQRMALLSADVRGQCQNLIIGKASQALDRDAACDVLGFKPSGREGKGLMKLKHEFWISGPALAEEPELVKFGPTATSKTPAWKQGPMLPPPSDAVAAMLGSFAAIEPDERDPEIITSERLAEAVAEAHAKGREEGIVLGYAAAAQRAIEALAATFPEAKAKQRGRPRIVSTEEVAA
jgi:uncharacterized protein